MTPPKGFCVECSRAVAADHYGVHEIHGYADERKGGGPNAVREIKRIDGRIWHSSCFPVWLHRQQGGQQGRLL